MSCLNGEQDSEGGSRGRLPGWLLVVLASVVVGIDQFTKWLVIAHLQRGEFIRLCSFVKIRHTDNAGIAFGLWADGGRALPLLAAVCIVLLLLWGSRYARQSGVVGWSLALLVGGALGNMVDRIRVGRVTDFIDVSFWPVFNFADACVVIGALMLLMHGLFLHKPAGCAKVGDETVVGEEGP